MVVLTIITICALIIIGFVILLYSDENEYIICGVIIILLSTLSLLGLLTTKTVSKDASILNKHIDHDKSKIIEENDEVTELYITVDGEEYHFKFKDVEQND